MKVRGVVKGKTIVLNENLDFEDGETVEVDIRTIEESPLEEYGIKPNPRSFEGEPMPEDGSFDTNELVNQLREEMGI